MSQNYSELFEYGKHINITGIPFYINLEDYYSHIEETLNSFRYGHKRPEVIILVILYSLAFLIGLVGNLLVVLVFAKRHKMRTVTNSFLVNLAVCDLLVVCVCMPFSVAMQVYRDWIYGNAWCKIMNFSQGMSVCSSIITLTVIGAERFYAVKKPFEARAFLSRRRMIKTIIGIWIISALLMSPALFVRDTVKHHDLATFHTCEEINWKYQSLKHIYNFIIILSLYIIPTGIVCVGYLKIGISLWGADFTLHGDCNEASNAERTLIGRRKVARMLFVMAVLFAVSWLPFQILSLVLDYVPHLYHIYGQTLQTVFAYSLWLGHSNSSVNPICYCIMSKSFKRAILDILSCCPGEYTAYGGKSSYFAPSMSLTMSTSGATTRSRIMPCSKNSYKLVRLSYQKEVAARGADSGSDNAKSSPELVKNITTKV